MNVIKYIVGSPFLLLFWVMLLVWIPITVIVVALLNICNAYYDSSFKINIRVTQNGDL